jgi:putative methyltransferase (TIGR04325 family)
MNFFFGRYDDFDSAMRAGLKYKDTGWNNPQLAHNVVDRRPVTLGDGRVSPADHFQPCHYAATFWLAKIIADSSRIVDLGGAGGASYEIFQAYCSLPSGAVWQVVDKPEMVDLGRKRHAALDSPALVFEERIDPAEPCDVLLVSGCIQYLEDPLGEADPANGLVEAFHTAPKHVLINKIPTRDGNDIWTLQNLGPTAVPYRVFSRETLFRYFQSRGYRLKDSWVVAEIGVEIPFHPQYSQSTISGLLFEQT